MKVIVLLVMEFICMFFDLLEVIVVIFWSVCLSLFSRLVVLCVRILLVGVVVIFLGW